MRNVPRIRGDLCFLLNSPGFEMIPGYIAAADHEMNKEKSMVCAADLGISAQNVRESPRTQRRSEQ